MRWNILIDAENNRFFDSNECSFYIGKLAAVFIVSHASPWL